MGNFPVSLQDGNAHVLLGFLEDLSFFQLFELGVRGRVRGETDHVNVPTFKDSLLYVDTLTNILSCLVAHRENNSVSTVDNFGDQLEDTSAYMIKLSF